MSRSQLGTTRHQLGMTRHLWTRGVGTASILGSEAAAGVQDKAPTRTPASDTVTRMSAVTLRLELSDEGRIPRPFDHLVVG